MKIESVKTYAQSLIDSGKNMDEVKSLVDEFIGDEDVTDNDGNVVDFSLKSKEIEEVDIELEVKKILDETTPEVKTTPTVINKSVEEKIYTPSQKSRVFSDSKSAFGIGHMIKYHTSGSEESKNILTSMGLKYTQVEGTNARGGFLVPEEYFNEILECVQQYGAFARNARTINMSRLVMNVPTLSSDLTVGLVAEAATKTHSNKEFARTTLTAKACAGITPFSEELLEDSPINLADYFAENYARATAYRVDWTGFMGDGTNDYSNMGINGLVPQLQANGATFACSSGAATANSITINDLTDLMSELQSSGYTPGRTKWYTSPYIYTRVLLRLQAAAGGNEIVTLANGTPSRSFLGYPVEFVEVLEGASQDANPSDTGVLILFGDLYKSSVLGMRKELKVDISTDVRFESDEIVLRGVSRFDVQHPFATTCAMVGLEI